MRVFFLFAGSFSAFIRPFSSTGFFGCPRLFCFARLSPFLSRLTPAYLLISVPAHFFSYPCSPPLPPHFSSAPSPLNLFPLRPFTYPYPFSLLSRLLTFYAPSAIRSLALFPLHFFTHPRPFSLPPPILPLPVRLLFRAFPLPLTPLISFSAPSAIRSLALSPLPLQSLVLFLLRSPSLIFLFSASNPTPLPHSFSPVAPFFPRPRILFYIISFSYLFVLFWLVCFSSYL